MADGEDRTPAPANIRADRSVLAVLLVIKSFDVGWAGMIDMVRQNGIVVALARIRAPASSAP
jgi:hypothetical protein